MECMSSHNQLPMTMMEWIFEMLSKRIELHYRKH